MEAKRQTRKFCRKRKERTLIYQSDAEKVDCIEQTEALVKDPRGRSARQSGGGEEGLREREKECLCTSSEEKYHHGSG